jgi:uncharacterized protein
MNKAITLMSLTFLMVLSVNAGIKERMEARQPELNKLKDALLIGENNKGYLTVKGRASKKDQKLINSENSDRKRVYKKLAKQTKVDITKIETRRAEQIAQKSKKGIWLQMSDGKWYKK